MLFVDGHNLTFGHDAAREKLLGGDPEGSRKYILECVRIYAASTRDQAMVVFDGTGGKTAPGKHGSVRYCFSGAGRSADAEILRRIRAHTGRREARIVTDDRTLAAAARRLGVKTVGLKKFLQEIQRLLREGPETVAAEPAAKYRGPSPADVEYWLTVFSDEDVTAAEKEPPRAPGKRKRK
ncbi:MAG: NYN domain-containing protein [Planctomycetota bacterium]